MCSAFQMNLGIADETSVIAKVSNIASTIGVDFGSGFYNILSNSIALNFVLYIDHKRSTGLNSYLYYVFSRSLMLSFSISGNTVCFSLW